MADELLESGYKDPAASLAGAVLQDGLRKIADRHSVVHKRGDGLDSLNQKIAAPGLYNASTRAQIDSWRHSRNAADHGNFGDYQADDIRRMVEGVRDLLARYLE